MGGKKDLLHGNSLDAAALLLGQWGPVKAVVTCYSKYGKGYVVKLTLSWYRLAIKCSKKLVWAHVKSCFKLSESHSTHSGSLGHCHAEKWWRSFRNTPVVCLIDWYIFQFIFQELEKILDFAFAVYLRPTSLGWWRVGDHCHRLGVHAYYSAQVGGTGANWKWISHTFIKTEKLASTWFSFGRLTIPGFWFGQFSTYTCSRKIYFSSFWSLWQRSHFLVLKTKTEGLGSPSPIGSSLTLPGASEPELWTAWVSSHWQLLCLTHYIQRDKAEGSGKLSSINVFQLLPSTGNNNRQQRGLQYGWPEEVSRHTKKGGNATEMWQHDQGAAKSDIIDTKKDLQFADIVRVFSPWFPTSLD